MSLVKTIDTTIDTQYCYDFDKSHKLKRKLSKFGNELKDKPLNEISCPICKKKMLALETHLNNYRKYKYTVCCDWCGWYCPTPFTNIKTLAVDMFKDWYEAYKLLDETSEHKDIDFSQYLCNDENTLAEYIKLREIEQFERE